MRELREMPQRIQIRQLRQIVLRQDKTLEIGYRVRKCRLNARDAIPC